MLKGLAKYYVVLGKTTSRSCKDAVEIFRPWRLWLLLWVANLASVTDCAMWPRARARRAQAVGRGVCHRAHRGASDAPHAVRGRGLAQWQGFLASVACCAAATWAVAAQQ